MAAHGKQHKSKRAKDRKQSNRQSKDVSPVDLSMHPVDGSFDSKMNRSMQSTYQVGEVDESGFVCLGIEECKVQKSRADLNRTTSLFQKAGFGGDSYSDNGSDYSSDADYSSGYNSAGAKSSNS